MIDRYLVLYFYNTKVGILRKLGNFTNNFSSNYISYNKNEHLVKNMYNILVHYDFEISNKSVMLKLN